MKQLHTKAILLKRINFGEADRVLTVLTPESGRLSMLAKGVRKQKSKLAGGIELFSESEITYIDGRSEMKTIVGTRLNVHFDKIVKDVNKTMLAYDLLQTMYDNTQHGVEEGTYGILYKSLHYLNGSDSESSLLLLWFTVQTLSLSGASINLEKPLNADSFNESSFYQYSYDDRSFISSDNGPFLPAHIKLMRLAIRASTPDKLEVIKEYQKLAGELASLMSNMLKMHKT